MAHNEHAAHGAGEELHHEPLPVKVYIGVFVGLLFLTFVTVAVTAFDFGAFDMVVAMAVAVAKASLVVLYFMNLKHDHDRLNAVIFLSGLFFLVVFIGPTMWDAFTRDSVDPVRGRAAEIQRSTTPVPATPGVAPGTQGETSPDEPAEGPGR